MEWVNVKNFKINSHHSFQFPAFSLCIDGGTRSTSPAGSISRLGEARETLHGLLSNVSSDLLRVLTKMSRWSNISFLCHFRRKNARDFEACVTSDKTIVDYKSDHSESGWKLCWFLSVFSAEKTWNQFWFYSFRFKKLNKSTYRGRFSKERRGHGRCGHFAHLLQSSGKASRFQVLWL